VTIIHQSLLHLESLDYSIRIQRVGVLYSIEQTDALFLTHPLHHHLQYTHPFISVIGGGIFVMKRAGTPFRKFFLGSTQPETAFRNLPFLGSV
jgi:hypothetical protein